MNYYKYVNQTNKQFNLHNQNVRGLRTKLPELKRNISLLYYDCLILVETWLNENILDSELGLHDYTIFRMDRSNFFSIYF